MSLEKPAAVAGDPVKSAKWDELTAGRTFTQADAPTLALLCQWYKIVELAQDDRVLGIGRLMAGPDETHDRQAHAGAAASRT